MLTPDQRTVLDALEHGAFCNTVHTTARELIALGYAREEFGRLAITEAGRLAVRRPAVTHHINSELIADLGNAYYENDPMSNPQAPRYELPEIAPEEPRPPLPATSDRRQRAMRAAGVASGRTGVWVDEKWVMEFIDALDATE